MKAAVIHELVTLHKAQSDGLLRAETVVDYAQDPSTALHSQFEWDDGVAGNRYRLMQARQLLRVAVTILPMIDEPCRAFVSLRDDRGRDTGGGYRAIEDVLRDDTRCDRFIEQARDDLIRLQAKYRVLEAMVPRFAQALAEACGSGDAGGGGCGARDRGVGTGIAARAWIGVVRDGAIRRGMDRTGAAGQGRRGWVGQGRIRPGMARRGRAGAVRHGVDGRGPDRRGLAGEVWRGAVGSGAAGWGMAWSGEAGLGMAGPERSGRAGEVLVRLGVAGQAGPDSVRPGPARRGVARVGNPPRHALATHGPAE